MRFANPEALWWLLAVAAGIVLGIALSSARRRALRRFAGDERHLATFAAEVGRNRRAVRGVLLAGAAVLGVLAAARPQWASGMDRVDQAGLDVVVVLDTSISMRAEDVSPNRFEVARRAAGSLIRRLAGNRVALVTFAGVATLNCPLTLDHGAARLFLDSVEPGQASVPGTALAAALRRAGEALRGDEDVADEAAGKVVVLLSDGEDHEREIDDALAALRRDGVVVFSIGVGTASGGPIPLDPGAGAGGGYKKDRQDRLVTTRLEEASLEKIAVETGGRYFRATPAEVEIDEILEELSGMDVRRFGSVLRTRYSERFQWPLALALIALLAEALTPDRRRIAEAGRGGAP